MLRALACRSRIVSVLRAMSTSAPKVQNFINGEFVDSSASKWIPLTNPATGEVIGQVPETTQGEMQDAVASASKAFETWSQVPVQQRQRVMLKFQALINENMDALAENITIEQGKTLADAKGDVFRGLEVVENSCSMSTIMMGETAQNLASNLDTYSYRVPLG